MAAEIAVPAGTVTFLFTDIEDSTLLWERDSVGMQAALADHDALLRDVAERHGGYVFAATGDGFAIAFSRPEDGVGAAVAAQMELVERDWTLVDGPLRVRMGLHTGTAVEREGNYFGPTVNLAARVMGVAVGGQVLLSGACAGLLRSGAIDVGVEPAGTRRLAGIEAPVEVRVLTGQGLVSDVAVHQRAGASQTLGVPRYSTSFVGRSDELSALVVELAQPGVVTIVGPGGMGKTRLAVEVAARVAEQTSRRVWFCDLASLSEPEAVAHQVAGTVDAAPPRGGDVVGAVVDALRRSDGVLVLDNCEHVLRAAGELTHRVIAQSDQLSVLATSRAPLGLAGERVSPLGSLDASSDGATLLAARVRDVAPELGNADADHQALVGLCLALDGMPLAIELAAAQARFMTPAELTARLDGRFELLRTEAPDRPDRQRSVEATVAWSYDLLSPAAQRLLALTSVCAGAVDLDLISGLWSALREPGRSEEPLAELVDRSMISVDRLGVRTRFRLLETIRAFGLQRLRDAGDEAAARYAHAGYVTAQLGELLGRFVAPGGGDNLPEIEAFWPELRAAVNTATTTNDTALTAELTWDLGTIALLTERSEVRDWIDDALSLDDIDKNTRFAGLLASGSITDWATGRFDIGLERWLKAKEVIESADRSWSYNIGIASSMHHLVRGDDDTARPEPLRPIELASMHDDEFGRLIIELARAQVETMTGHPEVGQEILERINREINEDGNVYLRAFRGHSSAVAWLDDDPQRALDATREARELSETYGFNWIAGTQLNYATNALVRLGRFDEAAVVLRAAIERLQSGGSIQSTPSTIRNTTTLLEHTGGLEDAAELVGWLTATAMGISGTPAMRQHTEGLRGRLADALGADRAEAAMRRGAESNTHDIINLAATTTRNL